MAELMAGKRTLSPPTEAAIHGRLPDLQYDNDHHEERQLMAHAQHTLAFLHRCP
jgi:hypothetical protein